MTPSHRFTRRLTGAVLLLVTLAASWAVPARADESTAPPEPGVGEGAEVGTPDWAQVSAGGYHTCGIRASGRLYCWGHDYEGQLGNGGADTDRPAPVQVA